MPAKKQKNEHENFYNCFRVDLSLKGKEFHGDCPFCNKVNHFFVSSEDGRFQCKSCSVQGNHYSFMNQLLETAQKQMRDQSINWLAANRSIDRRVLHWAGIAASPIGELTYFIPSKNDDGRLVNLYRAIVDKDQKLEIRSASAPCKQELYGRETIKNHDIVFVVEGHWDRLALIEVLANIKISNITKPPGEWKISPSQFDLTGGTLGTIAVVGLPGVGSFKEDWVNCLRAKTVIVITDNDKDRKICNVCKGPAFPADEACPKCDGTEGRVINPGKDGMEVILNKLTESQLVDKIYKLSWKPDDRIKDIRDLLCLR